jgi:hypothetical protein
LKVEDERLIKQFKKSTRLVPNAFGMSANGGGYGNYQSIPNWCKNICKMKIFLICLVFLSICSLLFSQAEKVKIDYKTEKIDSGDFSYIIHIVDIRNNSDSTVYAMYSEADKSVVNNGDTIILKHRIFGFYNDFSLDTVKRKLNYYLTGSFTFSGPPVIPFKSAAISKNEKKILMYYENHVPSIQSTNYFLVDFFVFIGKETWMKYGENKHGFTYLEKYNDKKNIIGITKFFKYDKGVLINTNFEAIESEYKAKGFRSFF